MNDDEDKQDALDEAVQAGVFRKEWTVSNGFEYILTEHGAYALLVTMQRVMELIHRRELQ